MGALKMTLTTHKLIKREVGLKYVGFLKEWDPGIEFDKTVIGEYKLWMCSLLSEQNLDFSNKTMAKIVAKAELRI